MPLKRTVWIDTIGNETRRLVLEEDRPVELAYAYAQARRLTGCLFLARVVNVLKGMHAAFVDIGMARNAYLSLDDLPSAAGDLDAAAPVQRKPLRGGQEIIVQVTKEPGGDKGPRVTMNPTLPGNYAVLLPTLQAVGVSRHIAAADTRARLHALGVRACPQGMGLILRTASEAADDAEITAEVHALAALWADIAAKARTTPAPALLYDEGDLVQRTRRDLGGDIRFGPFDETMESWLEKHLRRKVWLDSGAYLVFDACEAMTVVDVNSGKFTGRKDLQETLLRLNLEAAREAARQIRLRDIGGIVVIDFVDMETEAARAAVLEAFREAMAADRAKSHIHGFTGAGLLELTRRPVYQPLHASVLMPCPRCHGEGVLPRTEAAAHALLRDVRRARMAGNEGEIVLKAAPDVRAALEAIGLPPGVRTAKEERHEA